MEYEKDFVDNQCIDGFKDLYKIKGKHSVGILEIEETDYQVYGSEEVRWIWNRGLELN